MSDPLAELTPLQFRSAHGLAADLADCHSGAEVTQQLKRLPAIVGSDTLLVGEVARTGGEGGGATLTAEEEPSGTFDQETLAVFTDLWHQHPVVTRHFAAPARRALKISDFLSDREWRRTELFGDCYSARLGLGWEIATQIGFGPERQTCAALGRTGRDFGEGDRALLDVINPHLRASYARVEHEAAREERLGLLERGIEGRGELVVTVDRRGRLTPPGPPPRRSSSAGSTTSTSRAACRRRSRPGGGASAAPRTRPRSSCGGGSGGCGCGSSRGRTRTRS